MTAADLRTILNLVGTSRLAHMIGVSPSLLRKKASPDPHSSVGITARDEVAIRDALSRMLRQSRKQRADYV